jgi:uncharacterized protein (TIGR00299 family) protein
MLIGSLVDMGVPISVLESDLSKISSSLSLKSRKVKRGPLTCTLITPVFTSGFNNRRYDWSDFYEMIKKFKDDSSFYDSLKDSLDLLRTSENEVHDTDRSKPHELGSADTIFDLISFYSAVKFLEVRSLHSSGIPLSQGSINISHGTVPSVSPVTLQIIKKLKIPVFDSNLAPNFECCTPTGVSLLKYFKFGAMRNSVIVKTGFGAGQTNRKDVANLVTSMLMSPSNQNQDLSIVETNIDDMNLEIIGYFMEELFKLDIKDAWYTNILMKKGRPGLMISVLVDPNKVDPVINLLKLETKTFGVRIISSNQIRFKRKTETVLTKFGKLRVKVKLSDEGEEIDYSPEFEDCKKLAKMHNIPLKEIFEEAIIQSKIRPR